MATIPTIDLVAIVPAPLNDKRTTRAWTMFDWANSAYALVISVAIFPPYFLAVTPDTITIWGRTITDSVLYTYTFAAAYSLLLILTPLLSGLADIGGYQKRFLRFFTVLGSLACLAMMWYRPGSPWAFGSITFMLATIGFAGGLVFYNAYLPLIASPDQYDRLSARGFAMGYIGSVLLLVANLIVIHFYLFFGFKSEAGAVQVAFAMVGLWWLGFAQLSLRRLPDAKEQPMTRKLVSGGFKELKTVIRSLKDYPAIRWFLISFFFYDAGVQTVLYLAALFADKELHFDSTELIVLVLILQILGIAGSIGFAKLSEYIGNKSTLLIMLVLWIIVCFCAYAVQAKTTFYIVSAGVGFIMGIQAISRSTYSRLLPENTKDLNSWYSLFDVVDKLAIIVGTFLYGFIEMITGSMRYSSLALCIFFALGMLFMIPIPRLKPERK
jgi:MFS transporter, UMF1 family